MEQHQKNALQLTDFLEYQYLSALELAPDGKHAVFAVSKADLEENTYRSNLWLYDTEKQTVHRLTGMDQEKSACWLDSSTILFASMRDAGCKAAVEKGERWTIFYALSIHGGEALEQFRLPLSVSRIRPLEDGRFLLQATHHNAGIDLHQYEGLEKQAKEKELKHNQDYEILTEIPYWSNGEGYVDSLRERLYLYDPASKALTPITGEWQHASFCTVNGDHVLYLAHEFRGKEQQTEGLYAYHLSTGETETLVADGTWRIGMADYLDGKLFCTASDGKDFGLNQNKFFYWVKNGSLELLAEHDFGFGSSVGSDCRLSGGRIVQISGNALYFISTEGYCSYLKKLTVDGVIETLTAPRGSVDCLAVSEQDILFIGMRDLCLQELYTLKNGEEIRLTSFNDAALADKTLSAPETLSFENDGVALDGWVLKPANYQAGKKYPAILDIHGGPKTVYGTVLYHEMQVWANLGYFVFFCNPRGGDGKGNRFADIRGKYGTIDYEDLMKFTDLVLEHYPDIDAERVGVTGGSYGGFMTNWIIGHTDRFRCAASQRSISNWISMMCTTDIGYYFADDQNAATPWGDSEKLWYHSPLRYADRVKTPTLFIHSEQDYRCWLTEGLQMFTALKYHNVEARLCMFRGENHELSRSGKPRHRIKRLEEITAWFEQHLKA